jgi:hypothetical protein
MGNKMQVGARVRVKAKDLWWWFADEGLRNPRIIPAGTTGTLYQCYPQPNDPRPMLAIKWDDPELVRPNGLECGIGGKVGDAFPTFLEPVEDING